MSGWLGRLFGREKAGPVWIRPVWIEAGALRERIGDGRRHSRAQASLPSAGPEALVTVLRFSSCLRVFVVSGS